MRRLVLVISALAGVVFLTACSGAGFSARDSKPASGQLGRNLSMSYVPALGLPIRFMASTRSTNLFEGFYVCPATGPIKYVSDYNNNVINVYAGRFAGQAPCGQITSGLFGPWGLFVKPVSHDLYVANDLNHNIVVFHRGQTTAYNTFTDPSFQDPVDVTVAKDGTIIATNLLRPHFFPATGSISTWIEGPNGGKFVGNFPMATGQKGQFVTIQRNELSTTTILSARQIWAPYGLSRARQARAESRLKYQAYRSIRLAA